MCDAHVVLFYARSTFLLKFLIETIQLKYTIFKSVHFLVGGAKKNLCMIEYKFDVQSEIHG